MLLKEVAPDCLPTLAIEFGVFETDVDTALERRIERLNTIGRQEHDAFIVLQHAQEDADEFVAFKFVKTAFLQEDVGLVKKQDGIPARAHVQNTLELALHVARIEAEIASRHHVERDFHLLGH